MLADFGFPFSGPQFPQVWNVSLAVLAVQLGDGVTLRLPCPLWELSLPSVLQVLKSQDLCFLPEGTLGLRVWIVIRLHSRPGLIFPGHRQEVGLSTAGLSPLRGARPAASP